MTLALLAKLMLGLSTAGLVLLIGMIRDGKRADEANEALIASLMSQGDSRQATVLTEIPHNSADHAR